MRQPPEVGFMIIVVIASLVVISILTILLVRFYVSRFKKEQTEKADNLIQAATEKAKVIEIEARDKALKTGAGSRQRNYETPAGYHARG